MKAIQTQNDIEFLKASNDIPLDLINAIEQDFHQLLEEEGADEGPFAFVLPFRRAIILLEKGDNVLKAIGKMIHLEYIEKLVNRSTDYYRIAIRSDHEFHLMYTLVGIHNRKTEKWLEETAE